MEIRADVIIRAMVDGTAPVMSLLAFLALLFMASINVRLKSRHRILAGILSTTTSSGGKAVRIQRASDFLDVALLRSYYLAGLLSVGGLLLLPYLPMATETRAILWASFGGTAFISPGIIFLNYRNRDLDGERATRKRLQEAEVMATDSRPIELYDQVSGLYTLRFWMKALELRVRRKLWLYAPISVLLLELPELDAIRTRYGESVADEVVAQFASGLRNNIGVDDLSARMGYKRFAVAAMRCPAEKASIIGQRIVRNGSFITVLGDGAPLTHVLKVRWVSATSPAYSANPSRLLRTALATLDGSAQRYGAGAAEPSYPSLRAAA